MPAPRKEEDRQALAAEFVLGTLTAAERADTVFRLRADPDLKQAVEEWERRLAPLNDTVRPIDPPPELEQSINRRIAGSGREQGEVALLHRQLRGWQTASLVTGAIAAVLAGFIILRPTAPEAPLSPTGQYVAVLQTEGPGPAFVASVDLGRGVISVRRVAAQAQSGKSFELWRVGGGREQPESLGVIEDSLKIPATRLGGASADLSDTMFAISLEPTGGSPTGQPTGPILFTGKLVATE
jgi:anti-sigma-K factor RskA